VIVGSAPISAEANSMSDEESGRKRPHYPGHADWFTIPGRLLLICTLIACIGLFYWYFMSTAESLPGGSYPILIWIVPVALAGVAFFVAAAFIFERVGVRIYRRGGD
jgi:hypothetical protein